MLDQAIARFSELVWGPWLVIALVGGGFALGILSRFQPLRHCYRAWALIASSKQTSTRTGTHLSAWQTLSSALSGTLGMGNIAGVAAAISIGGAGAVFWMWISALAGMNTKFFTGTLSVLYSRRNRQNQRYGGMMYVLQDGLGRPGKWLACIFALAGAIGFLPALATNQLVQFLVETSANYTPIDLPRFSLRLCIGLGIAVVTAIVIYGGIQRISRIASLLTPWMVILYLFAVFTSLYAFRSELLHALTSIFTEAFSTQALLGGAQGAIFIGVRRAALSNEAGIGTDTLVHALAQPKHAAMQGLVSMLGPVIDTLCVCTCTALVILVSKANHQVDYQGVMLTAHAFSLAMPTMGLSMVGLCAIFFSLSTIFTFAYYGSQCARFLFGSKSQALYTIIYLITIVLVSVVPMLSIINLIDAAYGCMAVPTLIGIFLLKSRVFKSWNEYRTTIQAT